MTKPEAIEYIRRIFYVERKMEYLKNIDLESHKVIEMWEKLNFRDEEGHKIVRSLSKRRSLVDIANDMERHMQGKQANANSSHVEVDTTLMSQTVLI